MMRMSLFYLVILLLLSPSSGHHHVDLHHRGLTTIPADIPPSTDSLDLSGNLLTVIPNDSFINLSSLTSLDLSANLLQRLEPSAFRGLAKLVSLMLNDNRLVLGYKAYPPSVFRPLTSVKIINMQNNMPDGIPDVPSFPNDVFTSLGTLKELSIDGLRNTPFGSGMGRLYELKTLSVNFKDTGGTLNSQTFAAFANLSIETLDLSCESLKVGTLKHFPYLTRLRLQTDILTPALDAMADFRYRNLTSITIAQSNGYNGNEKDLNNLILSKNNTAELATICVKYLDLSDNRVVSLKKDTLFGFEHPECVERLNLGQNYLPVASSLMTITGFVRFKNLKYLNISPGRHSALASDRSPAGGAAKSGPITFSLPFLSSLQVLNASFLGGRVPDVPNLRLLNAGHLHTLDLSYIGIVRCTFTISGLENLKSFNISGFNCYILSPIFFKFFTSLEVLVARNCELSLGFEYDPNSVIFRSLKKLRTLDLSENGFTALRPDIFSPLVSLEQLILTNNKLIHIPESVFNLVSLKYLDISSNVISSLSTEEMKWLTRMIKSSDKESRSVALGRNPLLCTCNTMSFVHWVLDEHHRLVENCSLTCNLENGTVVNICKLKPLVRNMDVSCVSRFWLTFSIVGSSFLTVSIILGIFGYRYRWNIKYWFLTRCRRGHVYENVDSEQYQFDAFVAYNSLNYRWACVVLREILETQHGYSLCLHDRDFLPGASIQQNIVDAINNSRKVILVITKDFLRSDWCEFEIQMTGMRMVRDGRENAIIVIMMEEIPVSEMPKSLLNLWKNITFLLWESERPEEHGIFWDRLLEVMAR